MVYIRAKTVKGTKYGYLVESHWDSKKKTSKQITLKYLGKLDSIRLEDLPEEFREDEKIVSFLSANSSVNIKEKEALLKKLRRQTFELLTNGDLEGLLSLYEEHSSSYGILDFYENILKNVMYEIGELWDKKQLPIAAEHVASNVAHSFVKIQSDKLLRPSTKQTVLICTPLGESHNLGCNILESYLGSKGFKVYNISPSVPTDAIISSIREYRPNAILVSITLDENIQSAKRLVTKIKEKFKVPIFVGGRALIGKKDLNLGGIESQDFSMSDLAKMLATT